MREPNKFNIIVEISNFFIYFIRIALFLFCFPFTNRIICYIVVPKQSCALFEYVQENGYYD